MKWPFSQKSELKNFAWRKSPSLPKVTLPFDRELKATQRSYLISFLIILAFTGFYSYSYTTSQATQNQLVNVLVASQDIESPAKLEKHQVKIEKFPRKKLPTQIFDNFDEVIGKTLITSVSKNEVLQSKHFQIAVNPESISAQFSNSFAFTIDESWFVSKLPSLAKNDLIDLLVTNPQQEIGETITVASGLRVLEIQKDSLGRKTIVVNVTQAESQAILFARGLKLPMQLLVQPSIKTESLESSAENLFPEK